ncbi:MAG TPA: hypothetical protein VGW38_08895, partial [Chloroflexota bacterium]|nr:hypothetical protein [Chloroflexota bacterium]
ARQGRLQRARGFGPVLEQRLGEAAERILAERRSSRTKRKAMPQLELPTELHDGHERAPLRPAA